MKNSLVLLMTCVIAGVVATQRPCPKGLSTSKLVCYYSTLEEVRGCYCTHVVLPASSDFKSVEGLKNRVKGLKVYVTVNEFNQGLIDLLKNTKIDGLEVNLKKLDSKHDISDFISTIKTKIGTDLEIALSVPPKAELLAKYFDFKGLSKHADLFILQTAFLGASANVTFHPSRLSGMWDMQNTDSVVDLVSGLGAPLSKVVITAPVQAYQFTLQNEEYTAPGSPALELKSIDRTELCKIMKANSNWTLERDEDRAGPYIFSKNQWVAFDDLKSMDIKAKYARIRGLAGMALKDLSQDGGTQCGSTILEAAYNGLSTQSRAPRGAVLHSLEREIVDSSARPLDSVQLSPFSISRIIDTEGKVHVVRQDSRTEFKCSRQGYFVHPRSCNRFYRCVKFNQLTEDYNVFEFDCPAGLAFDERVEVCVWPGSLPHGTPCSGSSEIAPVPRGRFECPSEPGYYADPENCRWFFACLDHGKSSLTPYEFRCPFGLVFDGDRLVCEWPWLVPKCANGLGVNQDTQYYYGATNGLQNYDGLGSLGVVKLGGITGTIQQPIATIYSNVDSAALGLGYQNTGGYIEGSGLSYKAAQSLQNAGLLKVNNGVVYQTGEEYQNQQYDLQGGDVQGSTLQKLSGGVAGSINIIGGGYSAVGTLSGVDLSHNGQDGSGFLTVTDSPVSRVAPIPTVTAVPVPGIKTVAGFDTVRGGVIANVPELQYKVKTFKDAGLFNNLSTSYVNVVVTPSAHHQENTVGEGGYVVSTARPFTAVTPTSQIYVSSTPGYYQQIHSKPQQTAYTYQTVAQQAVGGYSYPKLAVQLHSSTPKPFGLQPAIVSSYYSVGSGKSHHPTVTGYYNLENSNAALAEQRNYAGYNKPTVKFEETPVVNAYFNSQNSKAAAEQQNLEYAQIHFTPKSVEVQPAVLSYSTPKPEAGYVYTKPSVKFEETPAVNTYFNLQSSDKAVGQQNLDNSQSYVTTKPIEVQPAEVSYSTPKPDTGYVYTKPSVKFEETPVVSTYFNLQSSNEASRQQNLEYTQVHVTPKPIEVQPAVVSYNTPKPDTGYVYTKLEQAPVVSSYFNLQNSNAAAEQQNVVYSQNYETLKPAVQPALVAYSTPKPNVGYVYPRPVVKFEEEPVVNSYFNLQTSKEGAGQQNLESYSKPAVVNTYNYVTPKPVVQSAVVSYSTPKPNASYVFLKPEVKLEQTPVVSSYFNLENSGKVVDQQNLEGYTYNKPVQNTYSYVTPNVGHQPETSQPVVSSYYNLQSSKAATDYSKSESGGYVYTQPAVKFETSEVTYSTTPRSEVSTGGYVYPKPETSQPVVSSYYNLQSSKSVADNSKFEAQGYVYTKPSVKFEEQPAVVNSYFNLQSSKAAADYSKSEAGGYVYSQPANKLGVSEVTYSTTSRPEVSTGGYVYPKPAIQFEETPVVSQPAVVNSYFNLQSSKSAADYSKSERGGYVYTQPAVKFETPEVTYSTTPRPEVSTGGYVYSKPAVQFEETPVQPAVVNSYFNLQSTKSAADYSKSESGGYVYTHPTVKFETPEVTYSTTPRPEVSKGGYVYSKPAVQFQETPVQPAVVNSYFNLQSSKSATDYSKSENGGYVYTQPAVKFETPEVTYSTTPRPEVSTGGYVYSKPDVQFEETPIQPAIVNTYFNLQSSKAVQNQVNYSYDSNYVTPTTGKPAIVSSYYNIGTSTPKSIFLEQNPKISYLPSTTAKPVLVEQKPAVVTSYFNLHSSNALEQQNQVKYDSNYNYVTPSTAKPIVQQQALVTSYYNIGSSTEKPVIIEQQPELVAYESPKISYLPSTTAKPVQLEQKPAIVSSYFNLHSSKSAEHDTSYNYVTPTTAEPVVAYESPKVNYLPSTTAKPILVQQQPAVVTSYFNLHNSKSAEQQNQAQYSYDTNYKYVTPTTEQPAVVAYESPKISYLPSTTAKPIVVDQQPAVVTSYFRQQPSNGYQYPKPAVNFEEVREEPFVKKTAYVTGNYQENNRGSYEYAQNYQQGGGKVVVEKYQVPDYERVKQVALERIQYQQPQVILNYVKSTPKPTFVSTIRTIATKKLQSVTPASVTYYDSSSTPQVVVSTTSRPVSRYSFSSLDDQYQYNDIVKSTTYQPSREYLPVTSPKVFKVVEHFVAPEVTTLARDYLPVKVTTPSRAYLPITTTSEPEITTLSREYLPVKARVKITSTTAIPQLRKVVRPVTVIKTNDAHPLLSAKLGAQCTCVSNKLTLRRKQKIIVVEDEENDDDYGDYEPQRVVDTVIPSTERIVKIRPPVTHVTELFYQKEKKEPTPSDQDIVTAVKTGLKLVKQAAKEGAKEGTREALARHGQGTIDCQRAGLFRHPTQCNKFYSCRWDCTKKKFTLHVFNCPVHLTFDNSLGACNWPSQGPACVDNTIITSD